MPVLLIEYPKCSTCQRAKVWLLAQGVKFNVRHIVTETPTVDELTDWIHTGKLDLDKLFNTSGLVYRGLGLKDKLKTLNEAEKIALLAGNGMLIKRPLLITDKGGAAGFKETVWQDLI